MCRYWSIWLDAVNFALENNNFEQSARAQRVGFKENRIGRLYDWKSERLDEYKIEDWKSVRLEECKIGKV